jgi:hypothetical protein
MTNVIPFQRKNPMPAIPAIEPNETIDAVEARQPFSFDMTQPTPGGLVLIDACVPLSLAVEFMNLVTRHREDATPDTPPHSNKRRSRKKAIA